MQTPKNTVMRDENGNIREGVKWYLELNDILVRFFGNECGYSRGFQRIAVGNKGYLGSVFELDIDKKPTQEFLDFIKEYHSILSTTSLLRGCFRFRLALLYF